ncbi:MAG TPA: phage holin family protein [Candidatus Binataceae bacterium]
MAKDNNNLGPVRVEQRTDDWPTLLGKLFDDFIRILRGEVKLLGAGIAFAIDSLVARSVRLMVLAAMALAGLFCLLAAAILLLHKWLEWWQAFGVMGVGLLFIVLVASLSRSTKALSEPTSDM